MAARRPRAEHRRRADPFAAAQRIDRGAAAAASAAASPPSAIVAARASAATRPRPAPGATRRPRLRRTRPPAARRRRCIAPRDAAGTSGASSPVHQRQKRGRPSAIRDIAQAHARRLLSLAFHRRSRCVVLRSADYRRRVPRRPAIPSSSSSRRWSPGRITASRTNFTPSPIVTSARMRHRLIAPAIAPATGNGGGGSLAASASRALRE